MRRAERSRGAALPVAMILLAVLTAVAVAAVSLSGQERVNAAAYSRIDFMNACANAAQAKIWSEMAYQGTSYLGGTAAVTYVKLPDQTVLKSPAHFDQAAAAMVKDVVLKVQASGGSSTTQQDDCTNRACIKALGPGTFAVLAHCTDAWGRELELELGITFAL